MSARIRPACFLDRDGVIIDDVNYLSDPSQLRLIEGAAAAIAKLNQAGVPAIVITNQSGVARGIFSEERVDEIHRELDAMLESLGARIDAYYVCPHHPSEGQGEYLRTCDCRKPEPGMLLRAAKEHAIDMANSFFIGDKQSDLEAARRAGCQGVLITDDEAKGSTARDLAAAVADCLPKLLKAL